MSTSRFSLKICYDQNPENPFTSWDCEPPIMYVYGRHDTVTNHGMPTVSDLLDLITDRQLSYYRKDILEAHDKTDEESIREYVSREQSFADLLRDELTGDDDNIELIETLARIAKLPHLRTSSRGYSQGDYADVLIVLTPEWFKKTGAPQNPKKAKATLENTKKLFDAWIWGDVYGFQLIEYTPLYHEDGTLSDVTDDKIIDSCWGFYGDDGLEAIRDHLPDEHKHLFEQAKEKISNL